MKLRFVIVLSAVVGMATFTGCKKVNGKGAIVSRTYDLSGFDKVDLSNQGDVVMVYDANQFVEVSTHENLFDALKLEVEGSTLKIGNKNGYSIGKFDELTFYVHGTNIVEANISGSGNITVADATAGSPFAAKVSGSGNIVVEDLNASSVTGNISGSGNLKFSGTSSNTDIRISGSGNIESFGLVSVDTKATISGSGNIETTTTHNLEIHISGSGDVKYKGTPTIDVDISGSGNVVNAN